jgi:ABC-type transporter Mla subunit MlaD
MAGTAKDSRASEAAVVDAAPQTMEAPDNVEEKPTATDCSTAGTSCTSMNPAATPAVTEDMSTVVDSLALESSEVPEGIEKEVSRISAAVARATRALQEMQAKVRECDAECKASETAADYLGSAIEKTQKAFDDLAAVAKSLKDRTVEIPIKAFSRSLDAANSALEQMTEVASKYDEKFRVTGKVRAAVSVPHEKCKTALAEVSSLATSASTAANVQLHDMSEGIFSQATALANSSASLVFRAAAALDDRFDVEGKALSAGNAALDKVQELDMRYHVKENISPLASKGLEKARGLDSKATGGRVTPMLLSAVEAGLVLASLGISFAQNGYETAKRQRQSEEDGPTQVEAAITEQCDDDSVDAAGNGDNTAKEPTFQTK